MTWYVTAVVIFLFVNIKEVVFDVVVFLLVVNIKDVVAVVIF